MTDENTNPVNPTTDTPAVEGTEEETQTTAPEFTPTPDPVAPQEGQPDQAGEAE